MSLTTLTTDQLAQMIDHTFLKAYAQEQDLKCLCDEAKANHFKMVAINSMPVAFCHEQLKETDIHVGAAISFPLGQTTIEAKTFESRDAIKNGADEIDYVLNIGKLKDRKLAYIEKEMATMVNLCHSNHVLVKVILETCYLDNTDIVNACQIAKRIKPDFVKTSTGFGSAGATVENVRLMKETVGDDVKVKAAGGIQTLRDVLSMIAAGAQRIGTSHGVEIINQMKQSQQDN
ncbi:deoxyribose-phosphate aldolase [Oenococcus kitaharae]|uniref:Deoxyribose-phosphate aldolase n=1 Tax=Oenococcus kitaharae DSM 17330 TaxID=1045004 RepID=G9WG25_9LACO|nr:Deoxyribose-phosphate aldolase [Oenococcus kitaharae DSM 17330]